MLPFDSNISECLDVKFVDERFDDLVDKDLVIIQAFVKQWDHLPAFGRFFYWACQNSCINILEWMVGEYRELNNGFPHLTKDKSISEEEWRSIFEVACHAESTDLLEILAQKLHRV